MTPLVEVRGLSKHFGGLHAVERVDCSLHEGEVVGLLGHNGAGKSTLIKVLAGVYAPDAGEIVLRGERREFASPAEARAAGIETIHQTLALAENLDAPANLFLGRELLTPWRTLDSDRMEHEALKVISRLNPKFTDMRKPVRAMSGGQRQTVAIARALYFNAKILIMDEPCAALGPAESRMVMETIQRLKADGIGIFLISHDMNEVFEACDRVTVMKNGAVVDTVNVADVTQEEVLGMIILGNGGGAGERRSPVTAAKCSSARSVAGRPWRSKLESTHFGEPTWLSGTSQEVFALQFVRQVLIANTGIRDGMVMTLQVQRMTIRSWTRFAERVTEKNFTGKWFFRGGLSTWPLETSLERAFADWRLPRGLMPNAERRLLRDFKRAYRISGDTNPPDVTDELGWLALMQHHGAPTRLLDWTYSPFVAAFFAMEALLANRKASSAVVWAIPGEPFDRPERLVKGKDLLASLNHYRRLRDGASFRQVFQQNRPKQRFVYPVNPGRLNQRLIIQQGVFLCQTDLACSFLRNLEATGKAFGGLRIFQILLPRQLLRDAMYALHLMNMNPASLFPGLDGYARNLRPRLHFMCHADIFDDTILQA